MSQSAANDQSGSIDISLDTPRPTAAPASASAAASNSSDSAAAGSASNSGAAKRGGKQSAAARMDNWDLPLGTLPTVQLSRSDIKSVAATAPPTTAAGGAAAASGAIPVGAAAAAAGARPKPVVVPEYSYIARRNPPKEHGWGSDVLYYPGWCYLLGLGAGTGAGIWMDRAKRTRDMPLRLRVNSYINSMGRTGSTWGNGFGCLAIFYATYKHIIINQRGQKDELSSIGGAGLAGATFFSPKGWKLSMFGGLACAGLMAGVEAGREYYEKPHVKQQVTRQLASIRRALPASLK